LSNKFKHEPQISKRFKKSLKSLDKEMKKRTTEKLKELLEEHMLASEKEKCVGMIRRLYLISCLPSKPWW
jgi:mRNA-degrading endonuclease RelE of RelBE toxin-antitoxin system